MCAMPSAHAPGPWLLEPARRRYAWGSPTALFELLCEQPDGEPLAELWYGAHPSGPSVVTAAGGAGLDELIAADPVAALGACAEQWRGRLPFMLKLIAAAQPLSIQVHPDAAHAAQAFAAEEASGVAAGDPSRRYQDGEAKPEVVCALGDFDALIDFRPVDDLVAQFAAAGLDALADTIRTGGIGAGVRRVLSADAATTEHTIDALVRHGSALARRLQEVYPGDPGVVIAALLNSVRLTAGEAAFLAPGTVHAYLGGVAVEVMATSDNVLRAGLTPKLVDVDEFLRVARVEAAPPDLLRPREDGAYPDRTAEFSVVRHEGAHAVDVVGPAIVVCTGGRVTLGALVLQPGAGAFVPAAIGATTLVGAGTAFVATPGRAA